MRQLAAVVTKHVDVSHKKTKLVDPPLLHSALMRVHRQRAMSCWHVLRLYHRLRFNLLTSEAMAEHIGSIVRFIEKRHSVGRNLSLPALLDATCFRAVGLTGGLENTAFLKAVLHRIFKNEELHFFTQERWRNRRHQAIMRQGGEPLAPSAALQLLRSAVMQRSKEAFMFPWVHRPVNPPKGFRGEPGAALLDVEFSEKLWEGWGSWIKTLLPNG